MKSNYQYICIEGNLGAGKTSLCKRAADDLNGDLILEQFSENPFLPLFYQDAERYALTVELFFMTERYKQLQHHSNNRDMFKNFVLSDYIFHKTYLFANNNLTAEEMRLFKTLFKILQHSAPVPELLIFLDRPVEVLLENIKKRNRLYELQITEDYLLGVQRAYHEYLHSVHDFPRIILRLEDKDFVNDDQVYQEILAYIVGKFDNKLIEIQL